jgi:hypothetical protein
VALFTPELKGPFLFLSLLPGLGIGDLAQPPFGVGVMFLRELVEEVDDAVPTVPRASRSMR